MIFIYIDIISLLFICINQKSDKKYTYIFSFLFRYPDPFRIHIPISRYGSNRIHNTGYLWSLYFIIFNGYDL